VSSCRKCNEEHAQWISDHPTLLLPSPEKSYQAWGLGFLMGSTKMASTGHSISQL
jgi:hypothetical protein